jgi:hypothetical protein
LALECQLNVKRGDGAVVLELVKGGRQFQCRINLQNGEVTFSIVPKANLPSPEFAPKANTSIHGPGTYDVSFANVDEQLFLWVNGHVVDFNGKTTYPSLGNNKPVDVQPIRGSEIPTDLAPAGIAVEGGAAVEMSHVKLLRDIYYTADADGDEGAARLEGHAREALWRALERRGGRSGDFPGIAGRGLYHRAANFVHYGSRRNSILSTAYSVDQILWRRHGWRARARPDTNQGHGAG